MKKIFLVTILILIFSCSLHKYKGQKSNNDSNLSETEKAIINDFLDGELKKERYLSYKDFEIVIIKEALKKMKSLDTYFYSLDEWNTMNKIKKSDDIKNLYFLDTIQIKKIKLELEKEIVYNWKVSDFKNINVKLISDEDLRKIINTGSYSPGVTKNLIVFLSRPIIIDKDSVFISFDIGNGEFGNYAITHFTALMRKVNNKWVEKGYYEDGVFY